MAVKTKTRIDKQLLRGMNQNYMGCECVYFSHGSIDSRSEHIPAGYIFGLNSFKMEADALPIVGLLNGNSVDLHGCYCAVEHFGGADKFHSYFDRPCQYFASDDCAYLTFLEDTFDC